MQPVEAPDDTFCIAVLGNFSGDAVSDAIPSETLWEPRRATPESVQNLLGLRPVIDVSLPGLPHPLHLEFRGLDELGPDSLFRRHEVFQDFREARSARKEGRSPPVGKDMADSPEGREGSAEEDAGAGGITETTSGTEPPGEGGGPGLLDAILEQGEENAQGGGGKESGGDLEDFVRRVVRPHLVPSAAEGEEAVAGLDRRISLLMGDLLHAPGFRELEAAWRSLVFLLSRGGSGGKTRVFLVPLPRTELEADLRSRHGPKDGRLFRLLSEPPLGVPGRRWAVVVGDYRFGGGEEDITLLRELAETARAAGVPWITGAGPGLEEAPDSTVPPEGVSGPVPGSPPWSDFRRDPGAEWVSLVAPRFLLRDRYGPDGLPCRAFDFREPVESQRDLLWGNGAYLCAALLAQGHAQAGWTFRPPDFGEMSGLPLSPQFGPGGTGPSPLERNLSAEAARGMARAGLVPLVAFPQQAKVMVGGLRSAAPDGPLLRGSWAPPG